MDTLDIYVVVRIGEHLPFKIKKKKKKHSFLHLHKLILRRSSAKDL